MTFYEAAVQVLLKAGHPLHAKEITEIALRENLLSHVGKEPEVTMSSRLAAMARRSHDGRLVAVEPDTYGLTDWNLVNQPEALEQSGKPEPRDESEPPLRGRERHPKVDPANVRVAGRGDRRRKHEEERRRKRRLAPAAELVFDLVGRVGRPLPLFDLAAAVREKELVGDDLGREGLQAILAAENQRREEDGRRPIFAFHDEGLVGLHGGPAPAEEPQDYPALIAQALARMAEERKAAPAAAGRGAGAVERALEEQRQRAIRQLRKRLADLDTQALESIVVAMLAEMGYRDVRVAKRHKEGSLFLTRRRMGLTEVRFAVRVIKGGRDVRREEIAELRRDMASHAAQMGVVVSPSDPTREARNEASQASAPLVTLLCADALADQLAERGVGVTTRTVQYVEYEEAAFRAALRRGPSALAEGEGEAQPRKASDVTAEERRARRERERKEWRERREKAREDRRRRKLEEKAEGAAGTQGEVAAGGAKGAAESAGGAAAAAGGEGAGEAQVAGGGEKAAAEAATATVDGAEAAGAGRPATEARPPGADSGPGEGDRPAAPRPAEDPVAMTFEEPPGAGASEPAKRSNASGDDA
ncbi:MAG TPA: HTH domain-containing protein [Vulgatibacter sp.]|nr:HTH domain-containing protein [Vulgatibacter sp.]